MYAIRTSRRTNRQPRWKQEPRRRWDYYLPATLRRCECGRARPPLGYVWKRAHAEIHDALDGRHACGDATLSGGINSEWSARPAAERASHLFRAWCREFSILAR